MGIQSIVYGYIDCPSESMAENAKIVESYAFDELYPFTNIFWCGSPSQYFNGVIGITGAFKQIEHDWDEWMARFCDLLSRIDAYEARVHLQSIMGEHSWILASEYTYETQYIKDRQARPVLPVALRGERWGIVSASENDFLPAMAEWTRRPLHPVHRWPM